MILHGACRIVKCDAARYEIQHYEIQSYEIRCYEEVRRYEIQCYEIPRYEIRSPLRDTVAEAMAQHMAFQILPRCFVSSSFLSLSLEFYTPARGDV